MADLVVAIPEPLPYQRPMLLSPVRNKCVVCGRKWGKTLLGLIACLEGHGPPGEGHLRGALDGATIRWVTDTYKTAEEVWKSLQASSRFAGDIRKSDTSVYFPGGGSVTVRSADASGLRGPFVDGVVFDETANCPETAWTEEIQPSMVVSRDQWSIFLGTPKGQGNWFYPLFRKHEVDPNWASWQRPTSENPFVLQSDLDRIREEVGSYVFGQEYLAQFLVAGGGLCKEPWLAHRYGITPSGDAFLDGATISVAEMTRITAVDLAASVKTTGDYTVLATLGLARGHMFVLDVTRKRVEGPDIIREIQRVYDRWKPDAVFIEAIGFQYSLIQAARRETLMPIRECQPDKDKAARFLPVTASFEGKRLHLPSPSPAVPWLRDVELELLAFTGTKEDEHDDVVDAIGYAHAELAKLAAGGRWWEGYSDLPEAHTPNPVEASSLGGRPSF